MKSQFPLVEMKKLVDKASTPVDVDPDAEYVQIGIRSHGKGLFDKGAVSGEALGDKRVFWVEPDCFVVNIVFAWEQAVGKTSNADFGKIASHRFPMYRPKPNKADVDYLVYLFKTRLGKHLLTLASPGGAGRNKTLGQTEFSRIEIPCPPFAEQKRIAEILSTWDRAIETTEKLIANSEAQKKALMQQLLTGKKRLPGFSGEWQKTKLGNLGRILKGAGVSRDDVQEAGFPAIRYGEIYTTHHYFIEEFQSFISSETAASSTPLRNGDILFTCSGETADEIGKSVAFVGADKAFAGGDIIILRDHKQSPRFLGYALNSPDLIRQKTRFGQGNSVVHINARNLAELTLDLPEFSEQEAIAKALDAARNTLIRLRLRLEKLRTEKSALMQQLLTGKRRVRTKGEAQAA